MSGGPPSLAAGPVSDVGHARRFRVSTLDSRISTWVLLRSTQPGPRKQHARDHTQQASLPRWSAGCKWGRVASADHAAAAPLLSFHLPCVPVLQGPIRSRSQDPLPGRCGFTIGAGPARLLPLEPLLPPSIANRPSSVVGDAEAAAHTAILTHLDACCLAIGDGGGTRGSILRSTALHSRGAPGMRWN